MDAEPRSYDDLAWFYDRYWGGRFHDAARPALEHLLYASLPARSRVLELCCGSGHLTSELVARGYRVFAVDGSLQMLRHARRRAPRAHLWCADAAQCSFGGAACDAAVSTFDSINHLLTAASVAAAFRFVAEALLPGGVFVFDVNTEKAYVSEWGKSSVVVEREAAMFVRGSYEPTSGIGQTSITAFRLDRGAWARTDVEVRQRCYSEEELSDLLATAGFEQVTARPAARVGMTGDLAVGRSFLSARKRG
jgi:SAM-dependent methyltransferase